MSLLNCFYLVYFAKEGEGKGGRLACIPLVSLLASFFFNIYSSLSIKKKDKKMRKAGLL